MTNNLKAERTLTAERLDDIKNQLGDDTFVGITRTAELKVPELRSIIEEIQHLRSQSLSTQQPVGEVRVKPLEWKTNSHASLWTGELAFGAYYTAYDEGNGGWRSFRHMFLSEADPIEVGFGAKDVALAAAQSDYSRNILSALHPNQESGE